MTRSTYAAAIIAAVILSFCLFTPGQAAVPDSLNYQGYLTDASGAAIEGSTEMMFTIYSDATSGAPLWSSAFLAVPVDQGLFSVELGGLANPFSPTLFNTPLWLGVTIRGDAEMVPRRPLATVGFAFKADDALSLQGQTPAAFDQSGHVTDMANPHGVDAAQAGAATQDAVDAESAARIAGDDAQSDALASHGATPPAHHTRYSDTEAIAASFAYILNADGAGSGLDADKLDGFDADEFLKKNVSQQSTANTTNDLLRIENTGTGRGMTVISTGGHGLYGKSSSGLAGVEGEGAGTGPGLRGSSSADHGTIGYTEAADKAGVFGNSPNRTGVWGNSDSGTGVYGVSTTGFGVNGESGENHGVRGLTRATNEWVPAVYGRNEGAGDGVYGWSQFRHGVYGVTTSSEIGDAGVYAINTGGGAAIISDGDAEVKGDLWVEGELRGNVGENNAPPFPRPAFDSGWIDATSDAYFTLGVGLYLPPATYDRDNFVVDLTYMHVTDTYTTIGPKHEYRANNTFNPWPNRGLTWSLEDNNDISVSVHNNSGHIHKVRLRVWYYR